MPFTRSLARVFLFALVPLVLFESAADVLLVASIRPVYAPCCSSIYDVDPPFSPSAIFGTQVGAMIVFLTVALTLVLIIVLWFSGRSRYA